MKCQNPTCDRSEGLGYRMVQTEPGSLCSICHGARDNGILKGIKLADKIITKEWERAQGKIAEINWEQIKKRVKEYPRK